MEIAVLPFSNPVGRNSLFAPGTFIFSNKVLISSWGEAEGWNTKPSLKKIMSQGANDAFSTKGKKCCVFPFLPCTERDEKRSFLPAGGKKAFCIWGQKTRVFVTVFGVLGTFFHHFCRGRDEKSPYKSDEKSSFHPLVVVYNFFQPRQFRFFF